MKLVGIIKTISIVLAGGSLLFLGFLFGMNYQTKKNIDLTTDTKNPTLVNDKKAYRELIKKCGDIPNEKLDLPKGHWTIVSAKLWSLNCKYIAWSVFNTGTVVINPDGSGTGVKGNAEEGVFIYNTKTQKITKLDVDESEYKSVGFEGWKDEDTLIFSSIYQGRVSAEYHIETNKITTLDKE